MLKNQIDFNNAKREIIAIWQDNADKPVATTGAYRRLIEIINYMLKEGYHYQDYAELVNEMIISHQVDSFHEHVDLVMATSYALRNFIVRLNQTMSEFTKDFHENQTPEGQQRLAEDYAIAVNEHSQLVAIQGRNNFELAHIYWTLKEREEALHGQ